MIERGMRDHVWEHELMFPHVVPSTERGNMSSQSLRHAAPSAGETASAVATGCTVTVKSDSKDLHLETNESYKLIVPADGSAITIDAPTYGESILRGGFARAQRACDG